MNIPDIELVNAIRLIAEINFLMAGVVTRYKWFVLNLTAVFSI